MEQTGHKISWSDGASGMVTGVKDVICFDSREAQLDTSMGVLHLQGEELQMKHFSVEKGEIHISGRLNSLHYTVSSGEKRRRLVSRLFQ